MAEPKDSHRPTGEYDGGYAPNAKAAHPRPAGEYEDGYTPEDPACARVSRPKHSVQHPSKVHGTLNAVIGKVEQSLGKLVHSKDLAASGAIREAFGQSEQELQKMKRGAEC
ncbi:hypothetical protein SpCBS45565_g05126 [Spizellomyces sp. 'palustris']|nr:hypothetical protein SpCBS45565_g05126 [Spizellomyces sp. 'palustris']